MVKAGIKKIFVDWKPVNTLVVLKQRSKYQ